MPPPRLRPMPGGHSDSSDSEIDDRIRAIRRRSGVGDSAAKASKKGKTNEKKKKKKRLAPQESIDRAWERFSVKRFSKAMNVLPFAPVAPSPLSDQGSELLSRGYERAAEECRRKVKKIIEECRRVNMRYRDPGWDIDWDLKMGLGHCLNRLDKVSYDVSLANMERPDASVPKAVKRVHEIFEKPTFMADVSGSDVKQGLVGDCWFISCVSGLANMPDGLRRCCVAYDTRVGIYGFVFWRDGEWIYSIIDDKLYLKSPTWDEASVQRNLLQQIDQDDVERVYRKTYQTGSKALFFAQNKDNNETWLPLVEKAYAKAHGDYGSLAGGWVGEGLEDLTGGVTTELLLSDVLDLDAFWDRELSRVNEEFLFGCTTGLMDNGYGERNGIAESHAYNIVSARTLRNGTRLLKLRNPWGKPRIGTWSGAWSDGSKEWTAEVQAELGHTFGSDSTFWISYADFLDKFQLIDRTRLFRDPDWRCCQRWIGVDVPWQAAAARGYHEAFRLRLSRESPIVLVLSQLDNRYYCGLKGPYLYRLQFRLHARDRPDAEDYIVRSHGNYLMVRSVSVELPALPSGDYTVFVSVVAERFNRIPSVEDVVKRELHHRADNEKLAQVGQAYDLAHSKAAAHMAARDALRKKADQSGASSARRAERRKAWAKRHLLEDLRRRQQKKNEEKRKRRREEKAKEKEAKKKEEEEEREKTRKERNEIKEKEAKELKEKMDQMEKEEELKDMKRKMEKMEKEEKDKDKEAEKQTQTKDATVQTADETKDKAVQADPAQLASTSTSGASTPQATPISTPKSEISMPETTPVDAVAPLTDSTDTGAKADKTDKAETDSKAGTADNSKTGTSKVDAEEAKDHNDTPCKEAAEKKCDNCASSSTRGENWGDKAAAPREDEEDFYDDSSDSPISDWEEWYSSDDLSTPARKRGQDGGVSGSGGGSENGGSNGDDNGKSKGHSKSNGSQKDGDDDSDSDDEADRPAPWNALCVVGLRVYSKDEGLEVEAVLEESSSLAEGGMGARGTQDLDSAQANAGGQRVVEGEGEMEGGEKEEKEEKGEEEEKEDEKVTKEEKATKEEKDTPKPAGSDTTSKDDASKDASKEASKDEAPKEDSPKDETADKSSTDDTKNEPKDTPSKDEPSKDTTNKDETKEI